MNSKATQRRNPAIPSIVRERVALTEPQGAEAWVYIYNTVPDARTRITSGDWRAHLNERANG